MIHRHCTYEKIVCPHRKEIIHSMIAEKSRVHRYLRGYLNKCTNGMCDIVKILIMIIKIDVYRGESSERNMIQNIATAEAGEGRPEKKTVVFWAYRVNRISRNATAMIEMLASNGELRVK